MVVLALGLSGTVTTLASATSLLLLTVFVVVNAALVVLKLRPGEAHGRFEVPVIVPILGALVCAGLVVARVAGGLAQRAWPPLHQLRWSPSPASQGRIRVLTDRDGPLPSSPMKGEVKSWVRGSMVLQAQVRHLPLHGRGWEGAVCFSLRPNRKWFGC